MNRKRNDPNESEEPLSDYPLLDSPEAVVKTLRLIHENLGVDKNRLDVFKLSRIHNPGAGDTDFKVDTATGVERASSLTGVIVAFRQARAYYKRAYGAGQGSKPPDCSSKDGFTGEGDPGGDCTRCPLAAFSSAPQGGGQACRELRQLLVLLPGQMLPHLMNITPTSLNNFTKYSLNLISAGASYWEVSTRMSMEPSVTASGMPIARMRFTLSSRLPAEQAAILAPYHERMRELLTPMSVDASAYEIVGDAPRMIVEAEDQKASSEDIPF